MQGTAEVADSGVVDQVYRACRTDGLDTGVRLGLDRVEASADIACLSACSRVRGGSREPRGGLLERGTLSSFRTRPAVRAEFGEP